MGGLQGLPFLQPPQQPDQQAPSPTPQPDPSQYTETAPTPDPFAQQKQVYQQQIQQNTPVDRNGVKGLLSNFFQGMGSSMMRQAGLPTPYDKVQQAQQGLDRIQQLQSTVSLQQEQLKDAVLRRQEMTRTPAGPEMQQYGIAPGTPITPAEKFDSMQKYQQQSMGMGPLIATTPEMQAQGLPSFAPMKLVDTMQRIVSKQQGPAGSIIATPDMVSKYQLPSEAVGKPVKLSDILNAEKMNMTRQGVQWVPDGAGGFMMLPTTSTRTFGKGAAASPQGSPSTPAGPPRAAGTPSSPRLPVSPTHATQQVGRAYDRANNEWRQVTAAQAQAQGMEQWEKTSPAETDKTMYSQRQFNDVQINTSRYTKAAQDAVKTPPTTGDYANLHTLINKAGPADFKIAVGEGGNVTVPGLSAFLEGMSRESRSEGYAALSPQAKNLYDGYVRTLSAVPAYIKGLTNVGRFNETQLEMELRNIADPTYKPEDIVRKQQQWQENIDRGVEGMTRIPGLDTTKDIRQRYEGTSGNAPSGAKHLLGGSANGLPEGTTGNNGKYVVRGGQWVTK